MVDMVQSRQCHEWASCLSVFKSVHFLLASLGTCKLPRVSLSVRPHIKLVLNYVDAIPPPAPIGLCGDGEAQEAGKQQLQRVSVQI